MALLSPGLLRSLTERRHLAETGAREGERKGWREGGKGGCFSPEAAAGGLQPRGSTQGWGRLAGRLPAPEQAPAEGPEGEGGLVVEWALCPV